METKSTFLQFCLLLLFLSCNQQRKAMEKNNPSIEAPDPMASYSPGDNWSLQWSDEFEGDTINRNNWSYQVEPPGRFNDEWQSYTNSSDNAYVENSCLVIKATHISENHGLGQYTSARIHSAQKQTFRYGKIAARIKLPYGEGIWPAFWMLGANIDENGGDTSWPQCGEIDILELYGSKDDGVIESNIHYANENEEHESMGAVSYHLERGRFADNFHIFELEWDNKKFIWSVDGQEFASKSIEEEKYSEFHNDFFLLLNIAVGGEWAGRPDKSTVFPQMMYIDWIRVYKKST